MTNDELVTMAADFFEECLDTLKNKGRDYSGKDNALHNFQDAAKSIGLPTKQIWYVYAYKHWCAIISWVKTGKLESEAFKSRIMDLINYSLIAYAIFLDEQDNK